MKRLIRNLKAFLYGVFVIIFFAGASEAFATNYGMYYYDGGSYGYYEGEDAQLVAEGYGEARCANAYDGGLHAAVFVEEFGSGLRDYDIMCNDSGWPDGRRIQTIGVAYSEPPQCPTGQEWDVELQSCVEPPSPETCEEQGKLWDKRIEACVDACPYGQLDGQCLQGEPVGDPNISEDGTECSPDSPDYKGIFEGKAYCDSNLPEPATCPEGEMAYIINDDGSGAYACGAPIKTPEETPQQETETTTTTTDENGNTVTTTTDNAGNTTTTTTDPNGNSSTTINYNGTDSETGEPCSASSVSCYETPDTEKGLCKDGGSLCDDVNDIKKTLEKKSDRTTKTGEFPTDTDAKVAAAESELSTGLDQIKAEIGGYFDLALTAGDMVCGPGVEVLGRTIQICPSTMKDQLAVIAQIVLLMAALISLMIVFR